MISILVPIMYIWLSIGSFLLKWDSTNDIAGNRIPELEAKQSHKQA